MLVLTHCDQYSKEKLEKFENDIQSHEITKLLIDYCRLGIANYGCLDYERLEVIDLEIRNFALQSNDRIVEKMRIEFLSKIIACAHKEVMVESLQLIYE